MAFQDKHVVRGDTFVSQRVAQVIEAIHDYCPELEVQWIPPEHRGEGDNAFRIMHRPVGGEPYVIFHVQNEQQFDARILKRIIVNDNRNGVPTYGEIEAAEKAAELVAKQRADDELEEAVDKMYHALKSPLNTYRLDKNTVIKDGIPFNAKDY